MSDDKPFARVVPADGRYYKVGGVIAKPSAPQDAKGDVRTINAAVQARERRAAVKALREAADVAWCEQCTDDMRIKEWLRARADAIERGTS